MLPKTRRLRSSAASGPTSSHRRAPPLSRARLPPRSLQAGDCRTHPRGLGAVLLRDLGPGGLSAYGYVRGLLRPGSSGRWLGRGWGPEPRLEARERAGKPRLGASRESRRVAGDGAGGGGTPWRPGVNGVTRPHQASSWGWGALGHSWLAS